jgi:uncharacterized protein (TIGR00255 family)
MAGTLRSMTGFGQAQGTLSARLRAQVRVSSLNSRFLEVVLRTRPRIDTTELDLAVRSVVGEGVSRGRVQVMLDLQQTGGGEGGLQLHWDVVSQLRDELARRPEGLELAPLSLRDLMSLPGFAEGMDELALTADEQQAVLALVAQARDGVIVTRIREAAALQPQITSEIALLRSFHGWLSASSEQMRGVLAGKLKEKLLPLLQAVIVPEERILQEAAIAATHCDVSEEVQRLAAHIDHLQRLLDDGGLVGKKLDFLLQEMLREINTSGSKCREAGMGEKVVDAKAALEKLREQFANLE